MTRMILAKGVGAALALAVMAGFAGQASADLREYCGSYARDVANRKTNGGADVLVGGQGKVGGTGAITRGAGSTILGTGVTGDRYKRAYTNAYERCVANYEGTRQPEKTAENAAPDQKVMVKKAGASEATDAASSNDVTDEKAGASDATNKKVAASDATGKKAAANEAGVKKVAANEGVNKDEACARKYRSYDPQIGKYKSLTGKWRPCRL